MNLGSQYIVLLLGFKSKWHHLNKLKYMTCHVGFWVVSREMKNGRTGKNQDPTLKAVFRKFSLSSSVIFLIKSNVLDLQC